MGLTDVGGELRGWWEEMVVRLGLEVSRGGEAFELVVGAYGGEDRHYHDLSHLRSVVERCRAIGGERGWDSDLNELEAAMWFHDVVYDARRSDNEAVSAEVAVKALVGMGLSGGRAERVAGIVRATRHNGTAGTEMEKLGCDIDLESLAVDERTFRGNTAAIREEYRHLSDDEFRKGRLAFLEKVLGRGRVFYGEEFERALGGAAVRNMRGAVERLRAGAGW